MKTFAEHINIEQETILNFCSTQIGIEVDSILNDSFSTHDFTFTSGNTKSPFKISGICEAKTRNITDDYYSGGVFLELQKFTNVITTVADERSKPERINDDIKGYYLIKYTNVTYLFDLEKINLGEVYIIQCPKSSSKDGNQQYHNKPVLFLQPDEAIVTIKN